ncbi:ABC transporter ATP-binding protein [Trinickia caryophylli]|uniref:Putative ABC transport system ATP-binding protein n=1 Tax=Trinickia caryophylli TaxID=28094 RepID=A0A1X7G5I3_TRICW|nr:ABC transporter ATP-binding protein [Trinickia caryophylli]PMS13816.1 ABC transporter ATP-binding protein [Trinickia caryophylli]TRX15383.1 ABC transporter ATP-binding protein [Trinickia caryophylli]WQE15724.1 ABC transporter ATP-binding protein [Trinickia caryophylli]SMF64282.1 putative ABC transport system ATP-binding protein [Trinickia caryophylli]GLU33359.1 ABC transporter ATP-binding protein [Trinickia caryophylli]
MQVASLKHASRSYGKGAARVDAVRDVSVDILGNRFTVLSGPSGSGKTTLLNLIGCIDRVNAGSVTVAGVEVTRMRDNALSDFRASQIGFIFQNFNLLPVLSAAENVEYPLTLLGTPAAARRRTAMELLEAVGLAKEARRRPGELSGGQRQRVAIARALATNPKLVLADEPTANLDSRTGAEIIELMRTMQRERSTSFLFSSHDPNVLSSADDVILIKDGTIVDTRRNVQDAPTGTRP